MFLCICIRVVSASPRIARTITWRLELNTYVDATEPSRTDVRGSRLCFREGTSLLPRILLLSPVLFIGFKFCNTKILMVRLQGYFAKSSPEKRFNNKNCFDARFRVRLSDSRSLPVPRFLALIDDDYMRSEMVVDFNLGFLVNLHDLSLLLWTGGQSLCINIPLHVHFSLTRTVT
jgi:hypothetical protein